MGTILLVDDDPGVLFTLSEIVESRGHAYIAVSGATEALSHASRADVTLRYAADELQIEVRDDGSGAAKGGSPGYGLVGVRERVKIYGGEMTAGAENGGGFVLRTRLPLGGRTA